jgi:hypothetical protein
VISLNQIAANALNKQHRALRSQKKVLQKLLDTAFATEFGTQYGFGEILASHDLIHEFKARVPAHTYNDMAVWWDESRKDKKNVTWKGVIKHYALSSGTSEGSSKYIPVSKQMIRAIQRSSMKQYFSILKEKEVPVSVFNGNSLMMGSSTNLQYFGAHYQGDLSGIITSRIPMWFEIFARPGVEVRRLPWREKIQTIAEQAGDWDVTMIGGIPAWICMVFEAVTKHYGVKSIHEVWPNLKVYFHGGVAVGPYMTTLQSYFNQEVFFFETYLASEGFFAYQSRLHAEGMKLITNNGIFYEFIPFNDENFDQDGNLRSRHPVTLTIDEVKEKEEYALLISTCAGAWRYLIGDTIRFESLKHMEIAITGRTKHFLSLCGEHLSVDNMTTAIREVSEQLGMKSKEFCVSGIKLEDGFMHQWYVGTDADFDPAEVGRLIDTKLKVLNDDYKTEREFGLKDIKVKLIPNSIFDKYLEMEGKQGAQVKFPRVLKSNQLQNWVQFIKQNGF